MQAEMLLLIQRLVVAMEDVSKDVKKMSVSLQNLTAIIPHMLNEKAVTDASRVSFEDAVDVPDARPGSERIHSSNPDNDAGNAVPHLDALNHSNTAAVNAERAEKCSPLTVSDYEELNPSPVFNDEMVVREIKSEPECDVSRSGCSFSMPTKIDSENDPLRVSTSSQNGYPDECHYLSGETCSMESPERFNVHETTLSSQTFWKTGNTQLSKRQDFSNCPDSQTCLKDDGARPIASTSYVEESEGEGVNESRGRQLMQRKSETVSTNEEQERSESYRLLSSNTSSQPSQLHEGSMLPFCCETCGKGFPYRCYWVKHMRIHTGDKVFKCSVCQKGFTDKSNMNAHMRIHSGAKPHKCRECGKTFGRSNALKVHLRLHTGESPFACQDCGRCFAESQTLLYHRRYVHHIWN